MLVCALAKNEGCPWPSCKHSFVLNFLQSMKSKVSWDKSLAAAIPSAIFSSEEPQHLALAVLVEGMWWTALRNWGTSQLRLCRFGAVCWAQGCRVALLGAWVNPRGFWWAVCSDVPFVPAEVCSSLLCQTSCLLLGASSPVTAFCFMVVFFKPLRRSLQSARFKSQLLLAISNPAGTSSLVSGVLIPNLSLWVEEHISSNLKENSNDLENCLLSLGGGEGWKQQLQGCALPWR